MEEILKALILGIVQGLTEFLPISSTAHLRIVPSFFGWDDMDAAYTAVIQLGTMIAILIYFRKDLTNVLKAVLNSIKSKDISSDNFKLFINISVGTIPILILGYLLKDLIRDEFRNMYLIAIVIIGFSLVMYLAEKISTKKKNIANIKIPDAIIIGIFQSLALIPGVSRSGSTISGGFFRNMTRESATRYSFLLSIPAIFISGLYELYSEIESLIYGPGLVSLLVATVVSGFVGYASIWFLLEYVKKHSLLLFIIYRVLFGFLILVLLYYNIIK